MNEILMKGGEKKMNKQVNENPTVIEDLPVDEAQQDDVMGGASLPNVPVYKIVIDPRQGDL